MGTPFALLIVEDSADDAELMVDSPREDGFEVSAERVETADAMRAAMDGKPWQAILRDYRLPAFGAPAALEILKQGGLDLPFIVVCGVLKPAEAVAPMKAGAHAQAIAQGGLYARPAELQFDTGQRGGPAGRRSRANAGGVALHAARRANRPFAPYHPRPGPERLNRYRRGQPAQRESVRFELRNAKAYGLVRNVIHAWRTEGVRNS